MTNAQENVFEKNQPSSLVFWINLFLILIDIALIFWKKNLLPDQVPLFYSRPWGEEQLVTNLFLFLLPILSFVVLLVNNLFSIIFLKKGDIFFIWINASISLLFTVLSTITLWKIIFLIT